MACQYIFSLETNFSCKVGPLPRLKINNQLLLAELEIRTKQYVQNLVQWMKKKTHKTFFPLVSLLKWGNLMWSHMVLWCVSVNQSLLGLYLLQVVIFSVNVWKKFLIHICMLVLKHSVKWYRTQSYLVAIHRNSPQSYLSKKRNLVQLCHLRCPRVEPG